MARSRLGGEWDMDWVEVGEVGVGVEGYREAWDLDLCWNDWENFVIILSDEECCESGGGIWYHLPGGSLLKHLQDD